jgi:hypothetical protein
MSAETWLNFGVLVVSAFAAIVAWRQALAAKRSEAESAKHAAEILEAQQKVADAVSRQTDLREAEDRRRIKWESVPAEGGWWEIVNRTGFRVEAMLDCDDEFVQIDEGDDDFRDVPPDSGLRVLWPNRLSIPNYAQLNVVWLDQGEVKTSPVALRR